MTITPEVIFVAENAVNDGTARAIVDAIQMARGHGHGRPEIGTLRTSAIVYRVPLRLVAAAVGRVKCKFCDTWLDLAQMSYEDPETGCKHVGDAADCMTCRALCLWISVGGPVPANVSLPRRVAERIKQMTGGAP